MPGWRSSRWARARLPPRTARCRAVRLLLVSWGQNRAQGGPHRRSHPSTTCSTSPGNPSAWEHRSIQPMGTLKGDIGVFGGHTGVVGVSHPSPTLPRYPNRPQRPRAQICPAHRGLEVGHSLLWGAQGGEPRGSEGHLESCGVSGGLWGSVPGCCCLPPSAGAAPHSGIGPGEWGTPLQSPLWGCALPAARRCGPAQRSAEGSGLGGNQEGSGTAPPPNRAPLELGTLLGTLSKYRYIPWDPPTIIQDPQTEDPPSSQNSDASHQELPKNGDLQHPLQTKDPHPLLY